MKNRFNITATALDVESLTETLNTLMHESCEVGAPMDYIDDIETHEQDNAVEFSAKQLTEAYRNAAETFVDSVQDNERTSNKDATEAAERIAYYERMRPSARRKQQLEKILAK